MLTGSPPFEGESVGEVLMKHMVAEVDTSGIEEPFASVIKKALAKDPAQRYQSAEEMVRAVYGAQHVQESVTAFNPASLTAVAEKVQRLISPGRVRFQEAQGCESNLPRESNLILGVPPARQPGHDLAYLSATGRTPVGQHCRTEHGPLAETSGAGRRPAGRQALAAGGSKPRCVCDRGDRVGRRPTPVWTAP